MDFVAKKETGEAKPEGEDTIVIRVCDSVCAGSVAIILVGGKQRSLPREEQHQDEEGVQELLFEDGQRSELFPLHVRRKMHRTGRHSRVGKAYRWLPSSCS